MCWIHDALDSRGRYDGRSWVVPVLFVVLLGFVLTLMYEVLAISWKTFVVAS